MIKENENFESLSSIKPSHSKSENYNLTLFTCPSASSSEFIEFEPDLRLQT